MIDARAGAERDQADKGEKTGTNTETHYLTSIVPSDMT